MSADTREFIQNLFMVAGGLGLFLYGMKMMVDGLEKLAGNRMRTILKVATVNRFLGVLVGALVTIVIQSSTATTVMIVGFVNAGLMTLIQAISLIIGANIGTTLTAHIVALDINTIAPLFIFFGLLMYLFVKKKRVKRVGFIILSIGVLFMGLTVMGTPLKTFAKMPGFQSMLVAFDNHFLALLAGFIFTVIVQSSTAATGIIVTMYLSGINLAFTNAVFIVLGINMGTTVTALLASLAANRESKRTALAHFFFSAFGCVLLGPLLSAFPGILTFFQTFWSDGARQIAMFHTLFNVTTAVLVVPFIKQFNMLLYKLVPEISEEKASAKRLLHISADDSKSLSSAFSQAHNELCRMGGIALDNLSLALDAFFEGNQEKAASVVDGESVVDYLHRQITSWMLRLKNIESTADTEKLGAMLYISSDIERISDHAENIAEYLPLIENSIGSVSKDAIMQLRELSDSVLRIISMSLSVYEKLDKSNIYEIEDLEEHIDDLTDQFIENHIDRQQTDACDPRAGVVLISLVTDLERCADHAINVAQNTPISVAAAVPA